MRKFSLIIAGMFACSSLSAQQPLTSPGPPAPGTGYIYQVRKAFLEQMKNAPHKEEAENEKEDDNLARFNRWFYFVEPRCFPSGNMPRPDVLLTESEKMSQQAAGAGLRTTAGAPIWSSLGPTNKINATVPVGLGRVNCLVLDPGDTNTLFAGAACGGIWVSHNGGTTWATATDNLPSMSIGDIAINPHHPDTMYAATGDKNSGTIGFLSLSWPGDTLIWGGLYSAGIVKSTDRGLTWHTTGLSFLQSARDIPRRLLIHPTHPDILLAATFDGIYRTADAGATWTMVKPGRFAGIEFRPQRPDTVYAIDTNDLFVSYDAGSTWSTLSPGINVHTPGFSFDFSIAVSPVSPNSIWLSDGNGTLFTSHDEGHTFNSTTIPGTINMYTGYCNVLVVSPVDSNNILGMGQNMGITYDGGLTWSSWEPTMTIVHPDVHAGVFNPLHPKTVFIADDGGISVTRNGGASWTDISAGLVISQMYGTSSSRQNPNVILCGLQDNSTLLNDGTGWALSNAPWGDGMYCKIHRLNDSAQIATHGFGASFISYDRGATFNPVFSYDAYFTVPILFHPNSLDTIYYPGFDIYASYDRGATTVNLTTGIAPFQDFGATSMAISPSNPKVMYACDLLHMIRTTDGGATWTDVTGSLPVAHAGLTHIAVDYKNPMLVYATMSGYHAGDKVFVSTTGGNTWTNRSNGLPNLPANCIEADSTIPGALFLGTDMGLYYSDSTITHWVQYGTGLPNTVISDIDVNYTNHKVRVATFGRGLWECNIVKPDISMVATVVADHINIYPNPTKNTWNIEMPAQISNNYSVVVQDVNGKTVNVRENVRTIDASKLAPGLYNITIVSGNQRYIGSAVKN